MMNDLELQKLPSKSADPSLEGAASHVHSRMSARSGDTLPPIARVFTPEEQKKFAVKERLQFSALCFTLFLAGWNDGSIGPLLPRMMSVYSVNFTIVSLIFVFACLGFVSGAIVNVFASTKYPFGKIMVAASVFQMIAYALQSPGLPFPVFVMAYTINGVGMAVQDAQANGYVASLRDNKETKMGILHAVYGAGALSAPLVATQFSQMKHWSFHFLVSLGIATINTVILSAVFRMKSHNESLADIGQEPVEDGGDGSDHSHFRQIMSQPMVHYLAVFIFIYVGVEVTIGGWIVTYIIQLRAGGPDSGYISAGFFGGLMVGRVALLWVNEKIGEKRAIFVYTLLAIGLEFVVWFVPSLIGGGVAVSIVGVLLGPIYPITMNVTGRVLPKWILTGAIGWIAGFGQAGSAALPFMTGAIANKAGIQSLQPLLVGMMGLMIILWALVTKSSKRQD